MQSVFFIPVVPWILITLIILPCCLSSKRANQLHNQAAAEVPLHKLPSRRCCTVSVTSTRSTNDRPGVIISVLYGVCAICRTHKAQRARQPSSLKYAVVHDRCTHITELQVYCDITASTTRSRSYRSLLSSALLCTSRAHAPRTKRRATPCFYRMQQQGKDVSRSSTRVRLCRFLSFISGV